MLCLILTACAAPPQTPPASSAPEPTPSIPVAPPGLAFPRQAPPEGERATMEALCYGTLVEEQGCLYVVADDLGGRYLPLWPSDFSATVENGLAQIHDGSGAVVARVGDWVRLGGGETGDWLPDGVTGVGDCAGPYWVIGDEVSGVSLADLPAHPTIAPLLDALTRQGVTLSAPEQSRAAYLYPEPGIVYALGDGALHLHLFPGAAPTPSFSEWPRVGAFESP